MRLETCFCYNRAALKKSLVGEAPLFFEGSEKKVEIFLREGPSIRPDRSRWEQVVAQANATILSTISNEHFDAYLLSESSLFVYDDRVVMITCGTTTLAKAITAMMAFIPRERIEFLMYERKNEQQPDAQPSVFDEDADLLQKHLPGAVFRFGKDRGNHVFLFHYHTEDFVPAAEDMTMEILMHDLADSVVDIFHCRHSPREIHTRTGIDKIFPGFTCDDHIFSPMGYSLNAIGDDEYYTFHVTPESGFSYASFETNHLFTNDLDRTVNKVLDIFQPASVALLLFQTQGLPLPKPRGYQSRGRTDLVSCGFNVNFEDFMRT